MTATLRPGDTSLATLERVYRTGVPARLHSDCRQALLASAALLREGAAADRPIYGVNTGFGKLAGIRIPAGEIESRQRNLVRSHCVGLGDRLPDAHVRLMMTLKLLALGRGASGVRPELVECLERMLGRNVLPDIPVQGSVGASGDLAPLAHLAAVMIGEGTASFEGRRSRRPESRPLPSVRRRASPCSTARSSRPRARSPPSSMPGGRPRARS